MSCKIVTHWDGVIHILRNPHGFTEEVVRQARLDAADFIESMPRVHVASDDALVVTLRDGASAVFLPSCDIAREVMRRLVVTPEGRIP